MGMRACVTTLSTLAVKPIRNDFRVDSETRGRFRLKNADAISFETIMKVDEDYVSLF